MYYSLLLCVKLQEHRHDGRNQDQRRSADCGVIVLSLWSPRQLEERIKCHTSRLQYCHRPMIVV